MAAFKFNPFQSLRRLLLFRPDVVQNEDLLRQTLRGWQIFFISITAVVGTGIFTDYARAAVTAGPGGLLIAIAVVGLLAIAVMDGLSEMVQIFPTVNPLVEFVDVFVDPALATCVAVSYWYAYASFMAVQLTSAASYVKPEKAEDDSSQDKGIRAVCFFIIAPAVIIFLNLRRVYIFGWIETLCGVLKIFLVFVLSGICIYVAGHNNGAKNLNEGVTKSNPFQAIILVIERIAFSFLGIESVAIMTFEAKDIIDVKVPSQIIAWITLMIYVIYAFTQDMCFDWNMKQPYVSSFLEPSPGPQRAAILVSVEKIWPNSGLTYALKVILIFCALSCANTTLFIASRTLFGSARYSDYATSILVSPFADSTAKGVPKWAVVLSGVFWTIWVPFVSLSDSDAAQEIISFFSNSGSICVLFVWGSICLAYIRYWWWFKMFKDTDNLTLKKYSRWNREGQPFGTMLWWTQPCLAFFGLIGSWLLVFIFPSALWWQGGLTKESFFQHYLSPFIIIGGWMMLKGYQFWLHRERPFLDVLYVRQDSEDEVKLLQTVANLTKYLKRSQVKPKRVDTEMERYHSRPRATGQDITNGSTRSPDSPTARNRRVPTNEHFQNTLDSETPVHTVPSRSW